MNNNLLLYGSFSRGDFTSESDVDMLTVINGNSYKAVYNKINISYYNIDKLTEMASTGSLFVFHLNRESRILIDENKILADIIFNKFILKNDYSEDIHFAKTLLSDIYQNYDKMNNYPFANSKISWCLRTFFSGIGANQKMAIFSREKVCYHFGKDAERFLKIKNRTTYEKRLVSKMINHINKHFSYNSTTITFRPELQAFRLDVNKKLFMPPQGEFDGY